VILLPAIDILGGQAVRLAQGEFARRTVYDAEPLQAARRWVAQGARALHVVDLDGAREGRPVNLEHVEAMARELPVPIQFGGGLRSLEAVEAAVRAGAARVVLGTAALTDVDLLDEALIRLGERVVVSVDARAGKLASAGWTVQSELAAMEAIERLGARGVRRFVYSSIERDGMLGGPDLVAAREVAAAVRGSFILSGGISSLQDLQAVRNLRQVNLTGVIAGTALYEERFTVAEAQALLDAR
jgi:phosphoribosylformimino-5-aminoimidazole carboxamide ribotide isomerase